MREKRKKRKREKKTINDEAKRKDFREERKKKDKVTKLVIKGAYSQK